MSTSTMQAIRIHDYGMPDALQFEEIPIPTPSDNEILVQVQAAGVLPVDVAVLEGFFRGIRFTSFPLIPGSAYAGVVTSIGKNVTGYDEGQAVFGRSPNGAFAEYITVPIGANPELPYHLRRRFQNQHRFLSNRRLPFPGVQIPHGVSYLMPQIFKQGRKC